MGTRREHPEVFRITDAGHAVSDDQASRTRRYLFSMAVRTACFLGAVVTSGALRWTLVAGAVVLPYVAVLIANAGRENGPRRPAPTMVLRDRPAVGGPGTPPPDAP
jgi:hypothetical protein